MHRRRLVSMNTRRQISVKICRNSIKTSKCIAHIRRATIGDVDIKNTHPFSKNDNSGRRWVLAHNGTMYMKESGGSVLFSTQPLELDGWKEVLQNRLLVYKDGENVYVGQKHNCTYIHDERKMRLLYLEYSRL